MEKFLFAFKLSKGSIIIGWIKLVLSAVIALILLAAMLFAAGLNESLKKAFKSKDDSSFKFYFYLVMITLCAIAYGIASFVLIIGSINHHRMKVLSFLIIDGVLSLILIFGLYQTSLNIFVVLITIVQLYFNFSVFCYWKQLNKQHKQRMENQEARSRNQNVPRVKCDFPRVSLETSNELL